LEVDSKILVDHLVPHPGYPLPRNVGVLYPQFFGDMLDSLADDFQISDNRVLCFVSCRKFSSPLAV
jgi:hypothetical protein